MTQHENSKGRSESFPMLHRFLSYCALTAVLAAVGCSSNDNPNTNDDLTISPVTVPCQDTAWSDEVCIPGGEFIMGHDALPYVKPPCPPGMLCGPGNPPLLDYAPRHKVRLSPYFIDRFPATNKQYRACVDAGQCQEDCVTRKRCTGGIFNEYSIHDPRLDDYPVLTVELQGAIDYCRWVGKRLPTEAEWERAARGRESYDYPWGNAVPDCSKYVCEMDFQPLGWTQLYSVPVGANVGDVSPEGVREMVTNALEYTADVYDLYYYHRSPVDNPQGPGGTGRHVVRGNHSVRNTLAGSFEYNGTRFPLPAWEREDSSAGGPRCARNDATGE
jgi:formylglycine-generating enzyme required for sulfatase activity